MAGYGNVLLQGVLGAVSGGAGSLVHDMDLDRKKQDAMDLERRKGEMAQKRLKFLDDLKRSNEAETRQRSADFYKQNKLPPEEIPGEEVDEQGNKIGDITAVSEPSRRAQAEYYASKSLLTGDKGIIDSARGEAKDVRAEDEQQRKAAVDERRASNEAERLRLQGLRDEAKSENERKRLDAMIARLNKGESGEGKEPAKIREVKALAELAFGGDIEKATSFAYGTNAKPRAEAVMSMFAALKDTDMDTGKASDRMKRAEEMVDALRGKDTASRGGVKVGGEKTEAKVETKAAPKEASKPKSKAEYDALPSGALYVNPKDGKTYRKP